MIFFLIVALLLHHGYACPNNCDFCSNPNSCNGCSKGYTLAADGSTCDSTTALSAGLIILIIFCSFVGLWLCFVVCRKCRKRHINAQQPYNQGGPTDININLAQSLDIQRNNNKLRALRIYFDRLSLQNTAKWTNKQSNEQQFSHQQICTICLNKSLDTKTHCGHGFHSECLQLWFNKSPTCPTCRTEIQFLVLYCKNCYKSHKIIRLAGTNDIKRQAKVCDRCEIGLS